MSDNGKIEELAALKSLELLEDEDNMAIDSLSSEDNALLESEAGALDKAKEALLYNFTPESPRAELKKSIISKIKKKPTDQTSQDKGFLYVRENEGSWVEVVKGVHVKDLFTDTERQYSTVLVKMDPGAAFPDHKHAEYEECYIISGELNMGGHKFTKGDYIRADADSMHHSIYSEIGCTLLVMASAKNEMIETHV
ncbi:MAG: hypothetical protein GWO07_07410 [Candidatus Dadabacteria bacterium]|nr:hypothetical protein [Candidatus Dadabacteria bacterium]